MAKPPFGTLPLTEKQENVVRLRARGYSNPEVIKEIWGKEKGDVGYHTCEAQIAKWMRHPSVPDIWRDEIKKTTLPLLSESLSILRKQMRKQDSEKNAWLINKAANDLLTFTRQQVFADEEKAITVQIQGMPEMGSPEKDES